MAVSKSDEDFIENVVRAFYQKATTDVLIGYHFRKIALAEAKAGDHPLKPPLEAFSHHLPRINEFWKNQLLNTPLPKDSAPFKLMVIHKELMIRKGEVNRWVSLFKEVLEEWRHCHEELTDQWLIKLNHFQNTFLHSKVLFP